MELVAFTKEVAQNIAEHAASYRLGQSALRHLDRALWVVEKCARWAVPPPLDQDERPQPELVRPLPWVFFLAMLVTLRITRESISLINLVLGKPPLRSADVVMYIQSKRRYLRTLKYQGNRMIRARTVPPTTHEPWYSRLQSLFEFTMCFRRSQNYGNNNTTRVSNNDEVLVVKRSKRTREPTTSPVASTSEATMERLIEKMMVDLDAESDDDSSFTLTNATGMRSDTDSENDNVENHEETLTSSRTNDTGVEENDMSGEKGHFTSSTPVKESEAQKTEDSGSPAKHKTDLSQQNSEDHQDTQEDANIPKCEDAASGSSNKLKMDLSAQNSEDHQDSKEDVQIPKSEDAASGSKKDLCQQNSEDHQVLQEEEVPKSEEAALQKSKSPKNSSPKEDTQKFIQGERCSPQKGQQSPKNTNIGVQTQRRETEIPGARSTHAGDAV